MERRLMTDEECAVGNDSRWVRFRVPVITGGSLGLAAFLADLFDGTVEATLVALTSSGTSWGLAALAASRWPQRPRDAAISAVATLSTGSLSYYLLIIVFSNRWRSGTTESGDPTHLAGLFSIAKAFTLWTGIAILAGPCLGLLGYLIARGPSRHASIAASIAFALLVGENINTLYNKANAYFAHGIIDSAAIIGSFLGIGLAAVALPLILALRKKESNWILFFLLTPVATLMSAALWFIVQHVRTYWL